MISSLVFRCCFVCSILTKATISHLPRSKQNLLNLQSSCEMPQKTFPYSICSRFLHALFLPLLQNILHIITIDALTIFPTKLSPWVQKLIFQEYLHNWGRITLKFRTIQNLKLLIFNLRNDHRQVIIVFWIIPITFNLKQWLHCFKYTVTQHEF